MSDLLASLLQAASEGERSDVLSFLRAFKEATLFVPEKEQSPRFNSLPAYPDRPLNILAVQDGDNVFVPVFSESTLIEKWCSRKLNVRSISTMDLIKLLPESWHVALNPGDDYRKDLTPWELQKLLDGDSGIEEIATELELPHGVEPLEVRKVTSSEFIPVKTALKILCDNNPEIREVYLAKEKGKTFEESEVETLLVGIKLKDLEPAEAEGIRLKVRDSLAPALIGAIQLRVLIGVGFSDLELGIFADFAPEFTTES